MTIISEIGKRYGDKLHGWWFDGGQRYYNCHFDNTPGDQGILSAPFKELTLAARSGNPERVVPYRGRMLGSQVYGPIASLRGETHNDGI